MGRAILVTLPEPGPTEGQVPTTVVRRGLGANVSVLAVSQAITWCATLVWTIVVPRLLGPAQMGTLVTSLAATAILGVVLGLPTRDFLVREMVARPTAAPMLMGTAMVFRLCLIPLFFALTEIYARLAQLSPDSSTVLHLCMGVTVCTLLAEPALAAFQATEHMEHLAYYEVLSKVLQGLGGVALALAGLRVVGLSSYNLLISIGLVLFAVSRVRWFVSIDWRTNFSRAWSLVKASAPYWTFGVFFMIYLWIDSVMLGLLSPAEVVGWYGVATKLFTTLMFVPAIISTAWLPRLVRAFESSPADLARVARAPLEIVFVLSLPICVATSTAAGAVIPVLYGESYSKAAPVLSILALCFPPMYVNIILYQVLIASRRPTPWMRLMAAATVVNPCLNLVLINVCQDRYANGALGAAWSMLLTELLIMTAGMAIVGRTIVSKVSTWKFFRAILAAVAMWVSMVATAPYGVVVSVPIGLTTFGVCATLLRVTSREQLMLVPSLVQAKFRYRADSPGGRRAL